MNKIKLGLNGTYGKMGLSIQEAVHDSDDFDLVAKIGKNDPKEQIIKYCNQCDIIIDFSTINGFESLIESVKNSNAKLLIGTTGLNEKHFAQLKDIAKNRAVLYAYNTSLGPNLVAQMAANAAKILKQYDVEILEMHHRYKKDAPSGTALMIGQEIAAAKGINFNETAVFNRNNNDQRSNNEIGFASIRAGGIYGDHEVIYANDHEIITIGTCALSRQAFSQGALFAAKWLYKQPSGFYSMKDVIGNLL
ncbi:MAG: 4-hydroxy-tetrahydrodipicolinate reductase [Rickettsiales bacterium]|nr:MAG: 4-hydroxy-tetrahydrodipicolinate reductase [Rickettsiales bacterium]